MLVINPDECIDCGVCEPECPIEAIVPDTDPSAEKWIDINARYADQWANITLKKEAMPEAEEFKGKPNKFEDYFSPESGEGD